MSHSCITRVIEGELGDHLPVLGGWIAAPKHMADINGVSLDAYWEDPMACSIAAYQKLGTDALADVFIPKHRGDFRCVDQDSYSHSDSDRDLSDVVAEIDAWPEPEKYADELERG